MDFDIAVLRLLLISVSCGIIFLIGRLLGFIPSFICGETMSYDNMNDNTVAENKNPDKPLSVVIEEKTLDLSNIKFDESIEDKKSFRPTTWDQYISQENIKGEMIDNVNGCKKLDEIYPHTIINGSAGSGKTALAELLAKELNVPFVQCIGNDLIDRQIVVDKIAQAQGGIFFVDEIHTISNRIGNWLLPCLEDWKIQGKKIEKFTLMGATTEKGELIRRLKPFVDRCEQLTLEEYKEEDIIKIIKQYKENVYPEINIDEKVFIKIAKNSRLTPRNAIRLLKLYVRVENINLIFERQGIIKDGITKKDIKLLEYLNNNEKAVGLEAIALYLGTSKNNYLYEIEGFLMQTGLIIRQPRGRCISSKGKELLNKIKVEYI